MGTLYPFSTFNDIFVKGPWGLRKFFSSGVTTPVNPRGRKWGGVLTPLFPRVITGEKVGWGTYPTETPGITGGKCGVISIIPIL